MTQQKWFAKKIVEWFAEHGRKHLPWQQSPNAYQVWISEIMLQQTQVATVIPYYQRFMERFPRLENLAQATEDEVLPYWAGLGYYARARNLLKAAKIVLENHHAQMPNELEALIALPGIGRSTAGAIVSLGHGVRASILDGNVKRVLTRFFAIPGWPDQRSVNEVLWELAEELTPTKNAAQYNQAMMDLGATLCTRTKPQCARCPLQARCTAYAQGEPTLYPHKKPLKAIPVRRSVFLIAENAQGQLLLERRPPSGIWGSLWSFPEFAETKLALEWVARSLKGKEIESAAWPVVTHQFSHFTLEIVPLRVLVKSRQSVMMDGTSKSWFLVHEGLELGVAAPVKRLLERIAKQEKANESRSVLSEVEA